MWLTRYGGYNNSMLDFLLQLTNLVLLQHLKLIVVKDLKMFDCLCSESDVSTEHIVCNSQDCAGTITKDENSCDAGSTTSCSCISNSSLF